MRVMIDNDLPPRLATALHAVFESDGDEVISLRAKFGRHDLKDEEWIPVLGKEGRWAVISADMRIAKKRPSRELFLSQGLVGFFLSPSLQKSPLHIQTARLLQIWPAIRDQHRLSDNGCFEVGFKSQRFRQIGR